MAHVVPGERSYRRSLQPKGADRAMSIADTLFDAVEEIQEYLEAPGIHFPGEILAHIHAVVDQMDNVRRELDSIQPDGTIYTPATGTKGNDAECPPAE